ncbi:PAS domain S-box protein [Flavobacterium chungangense]|uniref:histidine kinase n=1 Tax=Flavobacterium chungangense TaxID=554283 RepID=A0A6V6ZEA7_9FLAO|nr:PAS domain S-box protein [Flavobacterium chungangense]CAD0009886.1 Adaptive-response sensory-kinase SasA [Flavobacterium chungangense]
MNVKENEGEYHKLPFLNSKIKITITTAILYIIIAKASGFSFVPEINIAPFFPAVGFSIAALIILGRKAIFGVLLGSFIFSLWAFQPYLRGTATFEELVKPLSFCVLRPLIIGLNAIVVSRLTQLWCKTKYPFDKGINVLYFTFACLIGGFISVSLGIVSLAVTPYVNMNNFMAIWSNLFRSNILGAILFTPFVLSWLYKKEQTTKWTLSKKIEAIVLTLLTIATSIFVFTGNVQNESIIFFFLMWAAYRFDLKAITFVALIVTIISLYCTSVYSDEPVNNYWIHSYFMLQLFLFVNLVSIMFLYGTLEEKRNKTNKLGESEYKLNIEKNILEATIQSPNGISIFTLDTNFNYINFNSIHKDNVRNLYGFEIETGGNLFEYIKDPKVQKDAMKIYQSVLNGNIHIEEDKEENHLGDYWNNFISPIMDKNSTIIGISTISINATKQKLNEIELEKNNRILNGRIKEITCLQNIFEINSNNALSITDIIASCVKIIPEAFQFPETTNCRIIIPEHEYTAKDKKTYWNVRKNIILNKEEYGTLEIGCCKEKECVDSYLPEEMDLLGAIANILSKSFENHFAEENLKISEEKFRSFFENIMDVYFMSTLEGDLYEVSPSIYDYLGYTRTEMLSINMGDLYVYPGDRKKLKQELLANGEVKDYEIELMKKNGQVSSFAMTAKIISKGKEKISHFEGSVRCLDEWKENQLLIREQHRKIIKSEQDFRILFENVQDVFFKTDLKTDTILDVSPSCSYFNGITREELIGQSIYNIYPDIEQLKQMSEIIVSGREINDYNNEIIIKNQHYYVSINAKLICDAKGKPEYLVGALRNITERRVAEENLKISEENYRIIFESVQDVFFKTDLKTKTILDVSPSCRYFNGITREELIGQKMSIIYNNKPQMRLMFNEVATERKIIDFNNEIIIKGKLFYVSISAKIIYDENDEPEFAVGSIRDITERRLAEENLKLSEEKFRSIYESFEDIYFKRDLQGIILEISPSVEKYFDLSRESVISKNYNDFCYDRTDANKFYQTLIKEKEVNDFEQRFVTSKGEILYFSINAKLRYNDEGQPAFVEGTMRNVNERKKTELEIALANEKIKESEKKYRTIFESVNDVFFRASVKDQKIIDISPSCSYFNIKEEEVIGSNFGDFYHNLDDRLYILEELNSVGEIKNYNVEIVVHSKLYTVSINARIIYDENNVPEYIVGSIRDITDKIEAKENLKVSEEKFRSIYENFQDIYMKTTIDGILLDVSPSFEKNFQIPRSEFMGTSVFDYYPNKKNKELLLKKLRTQGHISDFDVQLYDSSGNPVYFSINAHLLYDEQGVPVNIEGTLRNINERRHMQDEMLTKNRKLEFQNTELEQFAYIASHDLQEPLITVSHCSELLEEELAGKLDEDQQHYLTFIRSSTSRMQLLVKGLLDYSRIGKERKTSIIDCNTIVSEVVLDMKSSIDESNAIIEYENLPKIEANATEMRQLFQNMISNAIKFRKREFSPKVKITAVMEDKKWVFSVTDNGIGIKKEDTDKVFVIFKRLHNRNEYQGTGIGLSHCKKIIEQHNGRIWVESKYNEGSTFKWTLPLN